MQRFVDDDFVDAGFVERIHDDFDATLSASAAVTSALSLTMPLSATLAANATVGATLSVSPSVAIGKPWQYPGVGIGIPLNR